MRGEHRSDGRRAGIQACARAGSARPIPPISPGLFGESQRPEQIDVVGREREPLDVLLDGARVGPR